MIKDISEILNFRFASGGSGGYSSSAWWPGGFPAFFSEYEHLLKSHPAVYNLFKYVIHVDIGIHINHQVNNNNIFCFSADLNLLIGFMKQHSVNFENLVMAGSDERLSKNFKILNSIKHRFSKIYYEAKDIECDWVQTIPMGTIMAYTVRNGGSDILEHINKQKNKTKLVASAFGSRWPKLTSRIKNRFTLKSFIQKNDFIDNMFCNPLKYYKRLCDYRFFLAPIGEGIQTPKICECIMCETIPVVTDHVVHRELRDIYELPLLIVNEWADVSEDFLNKQWDLTYSQVDWNLQKSKFLVCNFDKLLI